MAPVKTRCRHRLRNTWMRALGLIVGASSTLAVYAQSIRIPDLRSPPPSIVSMKAGEPCNACGRIVSIREIRVDRNNPRVPAEFRSGPGSPSGVVERNLVGAVIHLPLGGETAERPFLGGVGTPEARERFGESSYELLVRLDDDSMRTIERTDGSRYRIGDRVRLSGIGQIELVAE
jgi:hypothetical protein